MQKWLNNKEKGKKYNKQAVKADKTQKKSFKKS